MLQRQRDCAGEAVHESGDGGAFLGHGDEDFAGVSARIEADGDVALVSAHVELVGDGHALFFELVADGSRRRVQVLLLDHGLYGSDSFVGGFGGFRSCGRERLRLLASVAIDSNRLQAELPSLDVGFRNFFHARRLRKVHRLRDCAGDERLRGGHHLQVSHVSDGARALGRLK